jgi:hypothetical protein
MGFKLRVMVVGDMQDYLGGYRPAFLTSILGKSIWNPLVKPDKCSTRHSLPQLLGKTYQKH